MTHVFLKTVEKSITERIYLILKTPCFIEIIFPCCIQTELLNKIKYNFRIILELKDTMQM